MLCPAWGMGVWISPLPAHPCCRHPRPFSPLVILPCHIHCPGIPVLWSSHPVLPNGGCKVREYFKLYHRFVGTGKNIGFSTSAVSGIHWGSWTVSPVDKGGLLYTYLFDQLPWFWVWPQCGPTCDRYCINLWLHFSFFLVTDHSLYCVQIAVAITWLMQI